MQTLAIALALASIALGLASLALQRRAHRRLTARYAAEDDAAIAGEASADASA